MGNGYSSEDTVNLRLKLAFAGLPDRAGEQGRQLQNVEGQQVWQERRREVRSCDFACIFGDLGRFLNLGMAF